MNWKNEILEVIELQKEYKLKRSKAKSAYKKFKNKINYTNFWNTASNDLLLRPHDGAEWILEGFSKKKYHFIVRTSPSDKNYRDCCKYLLSLAELNIPEKEQY